MTKSTSHTIWTGADAAAATGGKLTGNWSVTGISIDSRTVEKGDLFVALSGDMQDGHAYVAPALKAGAEAAMVKAPVQNLPEGASVLEVEDTLKALEDLGRAARARTGAKIIAVTGSVGKTSTKELLATAFESLGQTHASAKSYNNHIGVPLTLARMHAGTDYGIFEIGMNHADEIRPLVKMVRPHIAIITTVAPVHVENFANGEDGIVDAKAEIFEGLEEGGIAVLNRDNPHFERLAEKARAAGAVSVISFGRDERADVRLLDLLVASNGSRVKAEVFGEEINYTLQIAGEHIAMNSLAVLAAVSLAGGSVQKAADALKNLAPLTGRGERHQLETSEAGNPVTLIDESYNASPTSMKAAFRVLALIDPGRGGRRIAILGDMLEMGKESANMHADLALPIKAAGIDLVYTCGAMMKNLHDALPVANRGGHRANSDELAQIVPDALAPGDVVMVKGSLGSKMKTVVEAMRALPPAAITSKSSDVRG